MRFYLKIKGQVQGVGYRYFVSETARKLSLTGWVRNCSNGDVECEAQGDKKILENFAGQLRAGHPWARVTAMDRQALPETKDESGFEIRF